MRQKLTSNTCKFLFVLFFLNSLFAADTLAQGNALNFDGLNDHIVIGPPTGLYPAGSAYTKEAWIKKGIYFTAENIISSSDPFWLEYDQHVNASNNYIIPYQEHYDVIDPDPMQQGRWTHMAVTYDGVSTMKLYRNGILVNTNTAVPYSSSGGQMYIGTFFDTDASSLGYFFSGSIDQVRVYNTALTQAQIQSDMVSSSSAVPANLRAYYSFDQGTAEGNNTGITTLTDLSGNGFHGTITNFANTGTSSNWVGSYAMIIPSATAASGVNSTSFTANWTTPVGGNATNIDQYFVDVSTTPDFSSPVTGSPFLISFGTNTANITGLTANTTYYYRVYADKGFSFQGAYSNTITVTTLNVLPVQLFTFTATKNQSGNNLLQWSTASEINSSYFELQRSENNTVYTTVQKITAAGFSATAKNYQYTDNNGNAPVYYYRLKMVDMDGKTGYSNIVLIRNATDGAITVYPNPVKDRFVINITDRSLLNTSAVLTDMNGHILQRVPVIQSATTVDIKNYASGMYFLRLLNGDVVKIIKQ